MASLALVRPAAACTECTPARPVTEKLWGELQPVDSNPLPSLRDSTEFNGHEIPDADTPLWRDVAPVGSYLFTAYTSGFQVWSLADPALPKRIAILDGWHGDFPHWPAGGHDIKIFRTVAAAPERDDLVAIGGAGSGVVVIDSGINRQADTADPAALYQHAGFIVDQISVQEIDGRLYAFATDQGAGPLVYDMTAARDLAAKNGGAACLEQVDEAGTRCSGVFLGRMTDHRSAYVGGAGDYVASSAFLETGVELFDVSSPANPRLVVKDLPDNAMGVALWRHNGSHLLAVRTTTEGRIYDVTNCLASGCKSFSQNLLWRQAMPHRSNQQKVQMSWSGATPVLHFSNWGSVAGLRGDFLFDVSDPDNPREIIPRNPDGSVKTLTIDGTTVDYFSWYYDDNPDGLAFFAPMAAKFSGRYLYRAGNSIVDVHEWIGPSGPTIVVEGPSEGWQGDLLDFTATPNTACAATAGGWSWSADGAEIVAGAGTAAVTLRWPRDSTAPSPDTKHVGATNSGCSGATVTTQRIEIADPEPAIAGVTATPSTAPQCTPITFEAVDPTGRGTLSFAWTVNTDPGTSGSGNPFPWDTGGLPELQAATTFTGAVEVTNATCPDGSGCEGQGSATVTLEPLSPLPSNGAFTPANEPYTAATVQLHADDPSDQVDLSGATEWAWDFEGDGVFTPFTDDPNDPVGGPNPSHLYEEADIAAACPGSTISDGLVSPACTFQVKVKVKNCLTDSGVISDVLEVTIAELTPLHAEFAAEPVPSLAGPSYFYEVGEEITFNDLSTGAEVYDYDWDGNGTFEDTGHTVPVTTKSYAAARDDFQPRLRVTRGGGTETDVFVHVEPITIFDPAPTTPPPSPRVSISGPTSGQTNTVYTFRASASNCTPSSTGWNWSVSGGTVSGASDRSTIDVSWARDGGKTIGVSNSSCSGASDSHFIRISGSDDGGGTLDLRAQFTVQPTSPAVGEPVTFDASGSTGDPEAYVWTFPGGVKKTGAVTTFTFQEPGSAAVELTVEKTGTAEECPFFFNICSDSKSKVLTVGKGSKLTASFETTASCETGFGHSLCTARVGEAVTFTADQVGADTYEWGFGDGSPVKKGRSVTHTWTAPESYTVTLTVGEGDQVVSDDRVISVEGEPVVEARTVVVPWLAQSANEEGLPQESDLYVHNPGPGPVTVTATFRKRGTPEPDPPQRTETIAENETVFLPDVVRGLFDRADHSGFVMIEVEEGSAQPVVTSFNRTFYSGDPSTPDDDQVFGQAVPGLQLESEAATRAAGAVEPHHLVGLNSTDERLAYFGISNPSDERVSLNLRFYDKQGELLWSTEEPVLIAPYGQRQYSPVRLREFLGVAPHDDYRVVIEAVGEGAFVRPYGANLRLPIRDPSFLRPGRTVDSEIFLVGALNTGGLNDISYRTDLVLSHPGAGVVNSQVTFIPVGFQSEATAPIVRTLQPGETERLTDVVGEWDVPFGIGVLRIVSDNPAGSFPAIQAESYDVSRPGQTFGQFMPALTRDDAAKAGDVHSLVGLRQERESATALWDYRTTAWIFNASETDVATYSIRYFDHQGNELGSESGVRLGRQKMRQLSPSQHPLPPEGIEGGFVMRIEVESGEILAAAQVVNSDNDPAYIVGR